MIANSPSSVSSFASSSSQKPSRLILLAGSLCLAAAVVAGAGCSCRECNDRDDMQERDLKQNKPTTDKPMDRSMQRPMDGSGNRSGDRMMNSGSGTGGAMGAATGSNSTTGKAMPQAAQSDAEFASMMSAHHATAIEMARYQGQNGTREDVRAMARRIADSQTMEQTKLDAIVREETRPKTTNNSLIVNRAASDIGMLRNARGVEVDRMFLTHMIEHHRSGIDMAKASMANLKREDVRTMAQKMVDDQSTEIGLMRNMLQ